MEKISFARYLIVIIYLDKLHAFDDAIPLSPTSDTPTTSVGQHDGHFWLEPEAISGSSLAPTNSSARINSFRGTNDSHTERRIVTTPNNDTNNSHTERRIVTTPSNDTNNSLTERRIVTTPSNDTNKRNNASTFDIVCPDGKDNDGCMGASARPVSSKVDTLVITIINHIQMVMTCAGFLANAATFVTLTLNGGRFSSLIRLLLRHQSMVDLGACAMGFAYLLLPSGHWMTGSRVADFIACYTWHSQGLYWAAVFVSIWNLVLIGVERYVMICLPFVYNTMTRKHFFYIFIVIYAGSFVCLIPAYMQVHFVGSVCLPEHYFKGNFGDNLYYGYSIFTLFVFYLLPVGAFVFLYGYVTSFHLTLWIC